MIANGTNTTVIPVGYVGPSSLSKTQVGCGTYSLNKRSNVPYVSLVGSSGFKKTITWGEIAQVPPGQLVTVGNDSYHGGDIFLNKGFDPCNTPGRITVPVELEVVETETIEGPTNALKPVFPCDTRGAKRAFLAMDAFADAGDLADGISVFVRGRKLDGSMKTANSLSQYSPPYGPGVGFLSALQYVVGELLMIPLGANANPSNVQNPHTLLDAADVFILYPFESALSDYIAWPASINVSGFPSEQAALPGSWFVIEY